MAAFARALTEVNRQTNGSPEPDALLADARLRLLWRGRMGMEKDAQREAFAEACACTS